MENLLKKKEFEENVEDENVELDQNESDYKEQSSDYQEPTWDEEHEDVPDVVDGGKVELEVKDESVEDESIKDKPIEGEPIEPEPEVQNQPQEKMLTQSQVNELVGRARQEGRMSAVKELVDRYGVSNENELNDVFGRGQAYDSLNDDFANTNRLYNEVMAENALLKSQVDMNRWEDIKLILGGKGLDITVENIEALLPSHPEWKSLKEDVEAVGMNSVDGVNGVNNVNGANKVKPSILQKLGEDVSPKNEEENEEEKARKLFGF